MILFLIGCGGDLSAFMPKVNFQRLELRSIDFERIDVDFVFDVDNPNPIGVPLKRFDYALAFEGIEVLSGNDPDGLQLVADGSSELALPVSIDFVGIYEAVDATRGLDYIGFGVKGGFGFDTDFGPVDIGYDEEGSFPALRTPRFELGKLRVLDFDDSQVGFGLDIGVDNDQGSNIDFSNLDFAMEFAGVRVGGGEVAEVGEVAGAQTGTLTIPFAVDYLDAVDALAAAASGEKMKVQMDADVDVATPFGTVPLTIDESGRIDVEEE